MTIMDGCTQTENLYTLAYPSLRSGWNWFIFNLSSVAKAGSSSPSIKSVKTLLPPPFPEALAAASLFKILTCTINVISRPL